VSNIGGKVTGRGTSFGRESTWVDFVDSLKKDFYPVEKYDDQYMRCVRKIGSWSNKIKQMWK
jgi:hypothetical protein